MSKVLIPQDIAEAGKRFLIERGHEIKLGSGIAPDVLKAELADCDAILVRTALITREVLASAPRLKVVAKHGVGVDNIDVQAATERGIQVVNAPESNANTVAEHVLGLMISLARNIVLSDKHLRAGDYAIRDKLLGFDLDSKTLGVLGLGRIGSILARKAKHGLGMNVVGFDLRLAPERTPPDIERLTQRDEVFQRADILSLHLPATPETRASIGGREFALMKPSALFINASRGEVVDEKALIEALQNKQIAGAALDVFEAEPPPQDHPLFTMDNVVVTPHSAALTREATVRMALHAAQGIDEVLRGQSPTWPLNVPLHTARA